MPTVTLPLVTVAPVTPRSRLLTLALRDQSFAFRPGQAALVGAGGQQLRRPYSIACSPERARETGMLELLIALEPDGTLGPHLASVSAGSSIDLEGPFGTFIFPVDPPQRRLLFVAGGTGIAPLRAMIDHVLRGNPEQSVSLLYSARNRDEFAFIDELRAYETAGRLELHQTVTRDDSATWSGGRGRIGRSHFESVLHDASHTLCFVCGPKAFVGESVNTLEALGVSGDAIRTEGWAVPRA